MIMKDIPLNDFCIEILNETLWFLENDNYKSVQLSGKTLTSQQADHYTSISYLEEIRAKGRGHNGFPDAICSHSFGVNGLHFTKDAGSLAEEVGLRVVDFYQKIQTQLNLKRNALWSVYPEETGFISWHNNANASAYNFIFTYSETGEGWWKHYDPVKKEIVTIPDVKGWQCKAGYFGAYEDGMDKVVYHSARNTGKGLRMTIAFVLDRSEMSSGIQEWVIEDIREE